VVQKLLNNPAIPNGVLNIGDDMFNRIFFGVLVVLLLSSYAYKFGY
jgi:hypothetical protein